MNQLTHGRLVPCAEARLPFRVGDSSLQPAVFLCRAAGAEQPLLGGADAPPAHRARAPEKGARYSPMVAQTVVRLSALLHVTASFDLFRGTSGNSVRDPGCEISPSDPG